MAGDERVENQDAVAQTDVAQPAAGKRGLPPAFPDAKDDSSQYEPPIKPEDLQWEDDADKPETGVEGGKGDDTGRPHPTEGEDELVSLAVEQGIPEDVARRLAEADPALLEQAMLDRDRLLAQIGQAAGTGEPEPEPRVTTQPKAPQEPQEPMDDLDKAIQEALAVEVDPDEVGPDAARAIETLKNATRVLAAQLKAYEAFTKDIVSRQEERRLATFRQEFDNWVNSLPDEWLPIFGKGTVDELRSAGRSDFIEARKRLIEMMEHIEAGLRRTGQPVPPVPQLATRALRVLFPDRAIKLDQKALLRRLQKRKSLMTQRPTRRSGGRPANPRLAAIELVREEMRKRGYEPVAEEKEPEVL